MVVTVGVFIAASEIESLDDAMTGLSLGVGVSAFVSVLFMIGLPVVDQATPTPAGLFYNSEVLAEFAAPIFLWTVLKRRWPLILATALPMVACQSRVAVIAVFFGLFYAWHPKSKVWTGAIALVLVTAAAGAIMLRIPSAGTRIVIWGATLLAATPLGNGLGWFEAAHPIEQFAHSDMIQAINELGIGCLFLAAIPVLIFWRNRGTNAERAVFVAICVEVAVSFPLHVPSGAFVAALVAGYLAGDRGGLYLGRPDGRGRNAENNQWRHAVARATDSGSRLGCGSLSIRSSPSPYAALG
jgi:hypothetical protein